MKKVKIFSILNSNAEFLIYNALAIWLLAKKILQDNSTCYSKEIYLYDIACKSNFLEFEHSRLKERSIFTNISFSKTAKIQKIIKI